MNKCKRGSLLLAHTGTQSGASWGTRDYLDSALFSLSNILSVNKVSLENVKGNSFIHASPQPYYFENSITVSTKVYNKYLLMSTRPCECIQTNTRTQMRIAK
jgi:hypothetical protein